MDNIIFYINNIGLGDELHFERPMILDLLEKNLITTEIVIVCFKDRKFLYENIFNNIFFVEDYEKVQDICPAISKLFGKEYIFQTATDVLHHPGSLWNYFGGITGMLYANVYVTNNKNIFNYVKINYYNNNNISEKFRSLILNINYLDELPAFNGEKFIVYHHRDKRDGAWDQSEDKLNHILKLQDKYNIVIFHANNYVNDKNIKVELVNRYTHLNNKRIYTTNNLKEYASFIHSDNCIAMISVWSGGSQICGFCNNTKAIVHFDRRQHQIHEFLQNGNVDNYINSENGFDFCCFTKTNRVFIKEEEYECIEKYLN